MKYEEARFKKLLSELGLPSAYKAKKNLTIYQGQTDTVVFGKDVLKIRDGNIENASLLTGPKLSFEELEEVMTISQKIKYAGFPHLEITFSANEIVARETSRAPDLNASDSLRGLPASAGKVTGICLIYPSTEVSTGKIVVMKNSKDLHLIMKHRPAGIILEEGNLLSHASILAREAGIPALVKVVDATKKLKNGDEIILDATAGLISIPRNR